MRLELTGRQVDITPALRRFVDRKVGRLERILNDSALSAQIVLSGTKRGRRADVTVHARGEKFLHGMGDGPTWEASISGAVDKIVQQAQTLKGKWKGRKRRGVKQARAAPSPATPRTEVSGALPHMPRTFLRSRQVIKALSVVQAMREIEAKGKEIVIFNDTDTAGVCVLFRRADGELTLVETKA